MLPDCSLFLSVFSLWHPLSLIEQRVQWGRIRTHWSRQTIRVEWPTRMEMAATSSWISLFLTLFFFCSCFPCKLGDLFFLENRPFSDVTRRSSPPELHPAILLPHGRAPPLPTVVAWVGYYSECLPAAPLLWLLCHTSSP
jgi:hypothetical protein